MYWIMAFTRIQFRSFLCCACMYICMWMFEFFFILLFYSAFCTPNFSLCFHAKSDIMYMAIRFFFFLCVMLLNQRSVCYHLWLQAQLYAFIPVTPPIFFLFLCSVSLSLASTFIWLLARYIFSLHPVGWLDSMIFPTLCDMFLSCFDDDDGDGDDDNNKPATTPTTICECIANYIYFNPSLAFVYARVWVGAREVSLFAFQYFPHFFFALHASL